MDKQQKKETKQVLLKRVEELTSALKQERADAINLRQRLNQNRLQEIRLAEENILHDLLAVFDNLQRAFSFVPEEIQSNAWVEGVLKIQQQLQAYFKRLDLQPIEALGQVFDAQTMEAVAMIKDSKKSSGMVVEEVLKGYKYKDQVLRVAQVKVSE
ncbi:MAG: nucleotide exchange factor GrpE [Candidatus Saccharibacteria bacterium]|nr:nucleotide exchange factor GrpE [Candidatus Saccharibacteria bacterium]